MRPLAKAPCRAGAGAYAGLSQKEIAPVLSENPDVTLITPTAPVDAARHGGRAKCLQRLVRLDMPVPPTVALSFDAVARIANGALPDMEALLGCFAPGALLVVRPSSQDPDWGGPGAMLNIGLAPSRMADLAQRLDSEAATQLTLRFVESFAVHVARLDPDDFSDLPSEPEAALAAALRAYEDATDEPFPEDPAVQLGEVLRSMAAAWQSTSARLLRQAKGAPADAGLGLVVQEMVPGLGPGQSGSGVLQLVNSDTGLPQITGRYLAQSQGREALRRGGALYLTCDPRGLSLEEEAPEAFAQIVAHARRMRERLREEMQIEFTLQDGAVHILDGVRVQRSGRAAVRIAVALARDGIIPEAEAVVRIEPRALNDMLHRQVAPEAVRDVIASGIAASPGAASGRIVFTAEAAQAAAARDEDCVLVRRETGPEDVRGMHAARAVLTERGGITSHAAVIGRGLGVPCVVGVRGVRFDAVRRLLILADGRRLGEGAEITVDGTSGEVLAGAQPLSEAALDDAFSTLLGWAEAVCDIGVRTNADTPADARAARNFGAEGIGLCRTEHMFFEPARLTVMREMIFADGPEARRAALEQLLPMQRSDFTELFRIMQGQPVCIRLFDPPLHEFLPQDRAGMRELAEALALPLPDVERRVRALGEYNPMLGLRGVRLGITVPEIYEMQARAIFEATLEASADGDPVRPEIMIPLVSARREVDLVRARIDAVAAAVRAERGRGFDYSLGVMVETPRAALRAGDIAQTAEFLSFGTNDLTQMTYGLSRDDAGRFMSDYVGQGVFPEDPFHLLDVEGVGELLRIATERGRAARPAVRVSMCGEHGGSPEAIAFCRALGFSYVSVSPFRVPVIRLAAAQSVLRDQVRVDAPIR